ncbi:hypothetical protein GUITHDRAFT_63691 [Guillardia theta CCMP2712]|uniref:Dephospho-CoA kinase n=1 Tax=Guillardia theta (strain CCMP2712) TaxID=905079 RepID=L1K1V8_GUITC|nr:hypothetical protein GUITHDRAFT_63691 [Guillardia theta CCMP2712]EKX54343.1 hypothetical protein GUITHDRAFT_63691 [Guillardia theta CCMP2712]|eukprot:XP_005841323.1 hypothetical protein GUITHDRAFT_63691 [Guillardia theta CCMP2712]
MRVIGLTGGIASGKSCVSNRFRALGYPVVDADAIAHGVLEKGTSSYHRVLRAFKDHDIVDSSGNINRAALRKLVFGNRDLNRKLKQCTHTSIALEMLRQVVIQGQPVVILDAPLLFESRANLLCKEVICVYCEEDVQISRCVPMDWWLDNDERSCALLQISSQMPVAKKKAMSDICIDNGGTLEDLNR